METKTLKPGETAEHEVGGRKITLKPLPLGKLKQAIAIITAAGEEMGAMNEKEGFPQVIERVVDKHGIPYLSLVAGEDIPKEWVMDNCTYPFLMRLLKDSFAVNGLPDFFQKATEAAAAAAGKSTTQPTPTAS